MPRTIPEITESLSKHTKRLIELRNEHISAMETLTQLLSISNSDEAMKAFRDLLHLNDIEMHIRHITSISLLEEQALLGYINLPNDNNSSLS
jgi:uncharacterized protein YerC